jgi:acyl-CoA reductase-like NAD-dependent aldehyde dehydrogenase/nicotinamidase-related amidase
MTDALVLIDLQNDFLAAPGLEPAAAELVRRAADLLDAWRATGRPVIHVHTRVRPDGSDALPHWRGRLRCVEGSPGAEPPAPLLPREGETVAVKTFYSGFDDPVLDEALHTQGVTGIVLAGLHLHACVRATALAAWQRGLTVTVAADVVGSDDPLQAAAVRRWMGSRGATFARADAISPDTLPPSQPSPPDPLSRHPTPPPRERGDLASEYRGEREGWGRPSPGEGAWGGGRGDGGEGWEGGGEVGSAVRRACAAARAAARPWADRPHAERTRHLLVAAELIEQRVPDFAERIAREVGKPLRDAAAEVRRTAALLRAAAGVEPPPRTAHGADAWSRRVPLGVVALVTPWNNPVAIPAGKFAPALAFGNVVVWKPSPAAPETARALHALLLEAGIPEGALELVSGGEPVARALFEDQDVDAVSLSGSSAAGWTAQEVCARRRLPLQAELGGNNGAIVWSDADLDAAADSVARGAFSFAGQRCTANRRVIVDRSVLDPFVDRLAATAGRLRLGDPLDPETDLGPLISESAARRVEALIARAQPACRLVTTPLGAPVARGAWLPPAILIAEDPAQEIVREETFGPVLVVQPAESFDHALELLNGVSQGLIAALFSPDPERRERFLANAQAGVLKLDRSTADAGAEAPFGGIKASGLGPPEHGPGNVEFYTRLQAVYGPGGR